jgi:hypothetical protein
MAAQPQRSQEEVTRMRKELTITELDTESVELLPSRETLHVHFNWAAVYASNSANAVNLFSHHSVAAASAHQNIAVIQG